MSETLSETLILAQGGGAKVEAESIVINIFVTSNEGATQIAGELMKTFVLTRIKS